MHTKLCPTTLTTLFKSWCLKLNIRTGWVPMRQDVHPSLLSSPGSR
jgi:hypothetical protein